MLHEFQGFQSFATANAYASGAELFKRTMRSVPLREIPACANVIGSHTIYKVKIEDDHMLRLKARIALHGKEDSAKDKPHSDCIICYPVGMCTILSTFSLRKWSQSKINVKTAFLQTVESERNVYALPPRDSKDKERCVWLLLTAKYGRIDANDMWQVFSH